MTAAYNTTHAITQFAEPVRNLMQSDDYAEWFPDAALKGQHSAEAFSTSARAALNDGQDSLMAVGLLSGFTGKGLGPGDVLLIDDPYASPDEARSEAVNERVWRFWTETADVRVDPRANVVVMFHRYHEDDLAGRLLATGRFEYVRFPAIADSNEDGSDPTGREPGELLSPMRPLEWLEARRSEDPLTFLGQFQGTPRPESGAFFRREWLKVVDASEVPKIDLWVRFWDLATSERQSADQTAGALCGMGDDQTLYIMDVTAFRAEWPDAAEMIAQVAERDGPSVRVGIEKVAALQSMVQDLARKATFRKWPLWPVRRTTDKKQWASGWAARAKFDKVRLVRGPWNQQFIDQALAFPLGKHDDQIDAVSGSYEVLWSLRGGAAPPPPEVRRDTLGYWQKLREASKQDVPADW